MGAGPTRPQYWEVALLLIAVILCYCVLYGPQVIVTLWVARYHLSPDQANWLVMSTLIPMCVAPLSYGYLLGHRSTREVIIWGLAGLGLATTGLSVADHPASILAFRFTQGLILPAIMTAVMARLGERALTLKLPLITYYLCATVIGGLVGRILTGYLAVSKPLAWIWGLWAGSLGCVTLAFIMMREELEIPLNKKTLTPPMAREALQLNSVRYTLCTAGLMFGIFAAALTLLPFRVSELGGDSSKIADRYWGYLLGALVALGASQLELWLKGRSRAASLGLLTMGFALWIGSTDADASDRLSIMVTLLCAGMFITHPLLAEHITSTRDDFRGVMSGLYVSSYYLGGLALTWIASRAYVLLGWRWTLWGMCGLAGLAIYFCTRAFSPADTREEPERSASTKAR